MKYSQLLQDLSVINVLEFHYSCQLIHIDRVSLAIHELENLHPNENTNYYIAFLLEKEKEKREIIK